MRVGRDWETEWGRWEMGFLLPLPPSVTSCPFLPHFSLLSSLLAPSLPLRLPSVPPFPSAPLNPHPSLPPPLPRHLSPLPIQNKLTRLSLPHSPPRPPRPLQPNRRPRNGHVDNRRSPNLRHHHKLHDVFPGRAGFLRIRKMGWSMIGDRGIVVWKMMGRGGCGVRGVCVYVCKNTENHTRCRILKLALE